MASPGRKPTPAIIRELEGNPGNRPIPETANSIPMKPDPPEWLTDEALEEWHRKADELYRLGLLTKMNYTLFEVLCSAYGQYRRFMAETNSKEAIKWMREYRLLCNEFGMSPASLSKVPIQAGDEDDDFDGIL